MNMNVSSAVAASDVTKVRIAPTTNAKLPGFLSDALSAALEAAVASGDEEMVDKALKSIVGNCEAEGQHGYFVTGFRNYTKVSRMLIGRIQTIGLHFGLYWTEDGIGEEILPARPDGLTLSVHAGLTQTLRDACAAGSFGAIDRALAQIETTCVQAKVSTFTTPYAKGEQFDELLRRAKRASMKTYLRWMLRGILREPVPETVAASAKVKPSRAELEARKQANRQKRLDDQPKRGASGQKDTSGKKGSGKK